MVIRTAIILFVFFAGPVYCQTLALDGSASQITFTVANLGIAVEGKFSGIDGKIIFSPSTPEASHFEIAVPAASIETGINLRDKHLKDETYLDVEKYPSITFVSKQVYRLNDGTLALKGLLSVKNITKEITIPFQVVKVNDTFRFTGRFTINRRDFSVGKNSFTMSDDVHVRLNVIATIAAF